MPTHSSFLDSYFEAAKQSQDRARFDAEQAMHMHDLQQHMQQFQQSQDLQEREFKQRQQYQTMLEKQAQQNHADLQSQRADTYLDQFRKEGGLVQDRPQAQEITSTAQEMKGPETQGMFGQMAPGAQGPSTVPLFQQLLQRQQPQLPITMQVAPEAQMRPGYEEQPTPSFVPQGRPDLAGKQFIAPTAEEKARQMAAGKMEEGKELWPTLSQEQYEANPEIWTALGVKPKEKYDPKIQEGLLTHFLGKNKAGEILPKWQSFVAAKAQKLGVDPSKLSYEDYEDVAKHVADDSQTSTAAILGGLTAHMDRTKIKDLEDAGALFGERLINDPGSQVPTDRDTQVAIEKYMNKQYGVSAPRKLGLRAEGNEDFSRRAIQSVDYINSMLDNPRLRAAIEKRNGPGWGRVGNLAQNIGSDFDLTQDEREIIQSFRSALNYTRFQEGQALFGGRIPIQLMAELTSSSPRAEQAKAEMKGALKAVKANAQGNLVSYEKSRFGGKVPEPFWANQNISKADFAENELTSVPPALANMAKGDQILVTDPKSKSQSMITRHEDGKWYERPLK